MARRTSRRGPKGAHGARGERGERGARGPAGPSLSRARILAAVEEQFADIRTELDVQLTRFGQLQAQLDRVEKLLKKLVVAP